MKRQEKDFGKMGTVLKIGVRIWAGIRVIKWLSEFAVWAAKNAAMRLW